MLLKKILLMYILRWYWLFKICQSNLLWVQISKRCVLFWDELKPFLWNQGGNVSRQSLNSQAELQCLKKTGYTTQADLMSY